MTNHPANNRGCPTSTSVIVSPRQSATGAILSGTNTTAVKPVTLSSARRVTIGIDAQKLLPITIADNEREGGFYILGQPRTGKSTLLVSMALQDIANGRGLLFIDPHYDGFYT